LNGIQFEPEEKNLKTMIYAKRIPQTRNFAGIFDELFNSFPANVVSESNTTSAPVNTYEDEQGYHLELNAPGRNKEDFKLNVENGILTISYQKKAETENKPQKNLRNEFSFASFKRSFNLDEKINADGIEAKYENGILKMFLPKKEEVKITPKNISVE
jgi:HSP20 family protein